MNTNKEWISISDMMAGLMMVFLFIAIVFIMEVEKEQKAVEDITNTYKSVREELYRDLQAEFKNDLDRWGAEILPDITIRFNEPSVLFAANSSVIRPRFKQILDNFFPRYLQILSSDKYRNEIEEVRIEGHTSSRWNGATTLEDRYLPNTQLSQERSLSVLKYSFKLPKVKSERPWLVKVLRANGLSFAKIIYRKNVDKEDYSRSRRVEFRVKTKAEDRIFEIIKAMQG